MVSGPLTNSADTCNISTHSSNTFLSTARNRPVEESRCKLRAGSRSPLDQEPDIKSTVLICLPVIASKYRQVPWFCKVCRNPKHHIRVCTFPISTLLSRNIDLTRLLGTAKTARCIRSPRTLAGSLRTWLDYICLRSSTDCYICTNKVSYTGT